MSDDPGFLVQMGLRTPDLVAGFLGGVVNAFVMKRADPWSIIGSMIVGALTANYLTDPFSRYLGTGTGTTGFLVGIAGMAIVQGIIEGAKAWRPFGPSRNGNGGNNAGTGS